MVYLFQVFMIEFKQLLYISVFIEDSFMIYANYNLIIFFSMLRFASYSCNFFWRSIFSFLYSQWAPVENTILWRFSSFYASHFSYSYLIWNVSFSLSLEWRNSDTYHLLDIAIDILIFSTKFFAFIVSHFFFNNLSCLFSKVSLILLLRSWEFNELVIIWLVNIFTNSFQQPTVWNLSMLYFRDKIYCVTMLNYIWIKIF